ncbi:hypothetical protein [Plantactinospora sp. CA-290183]|uniref:hypothetical protein n=1 Tax=Plantactinospora sp. CA-290183 TaxID=3240006 RepID=UPI003D8B6B43
MTDDASTPTADDGTGIGRYGATGSPVGEPDRPPLATGTPDPAPAEPGPSGPVNRRRRRLTIAAIAGAAVFVLLVCGCFGALAATFGKLAREADHGRQVHARAESACADLEKRLNRLTPPGATVNPGQRAAAIRNENAALRPFLSEIDRLPGQWRDEDDDEDASRRDDGWRQLLDARTSFADALDRQVTNGEPAFFLAPQDRDGRPMLDRLQRGPEACAAAARRLAAPDL